MNRIILTVAKPNGARRKVIVEMPPSKEGRRAALKAAAIAEDETILHYDDRQLTPPNWSAA